MTNRSGSALRRRSKRFLTLILAFLMTAELAFEPAHDLLTLKAKAATDTDEYSEADIPEEYIPDDYGAEDDASASDTEAESSVPDPSVADAELESGSPEPICDDDPAADETHCNDKNDFYGEDSIEIESIRADAAKPVFAALFAAPSPTGTLSSFDLRDFGRVTSVKDQNPYGTCWAHSAINSVESNILSSTAVTDVDLSEKHLLYYTDARNSDKLGNIAGEGYYDLKSNTLNDWLDSGGSQTILESMLTNWYGAADESYMPYDTVTPKETQLAEKYPAADAYAQDSYHVRDAITVSTEDTEHIKNLLVKYGSCAFSIRYYKNGNEDPYYNPDTYSFYNYEGGETDHAVSIVGWDDDYDKSNFIDPNGTLKKNGAWLVKNSWDSDWGDNGYFWLSYEDTSICCKEDGKTKYNAVSFYTAVPASEDYNLYTYDASYPYGYQVLPTASAKFANVYTAADDEYLTEVCLFTGVPNQSYSLQVYTGVSGTANPTAGTAAFTSPQSGKMVEIGYHTITLDKPVALKKGQRFSIVPTYTSANSQVYMYYEITKDNDFIKYNSKAASGQSYFYYNGTWRDNCENIKGSLCIKGITSKTAPTAPDSVRMNTHSASLDLGGSMQLNPTITGGSGYIPVWESSDESVAIVTGNGTVVQVGSGSAKITVTVGGVSDFCWINKLVPATGLTLNKSSAKTSVGRQLDLAAAITPIDNTDELTVEWTSSDPSVATVSADGVVSGVSIGTVTITAAAGTLSASCEVEICNNVDADGVTFSNGETKLNLFKGEEAYKLVAVISPFNAIQQTVEWSSSNPDVAAVDPDGNVTPCGKGTCTITAVTENEVSGECTVNVYDLADYADLATAIIDVTQATGSSALLSWEAVAGVSGYQILRSTSADVDSFIPIVNVTTPYRTEYLDRTITRGVKYYYIVRPYVVIGGRKIYGADSNVDSLTTVSDKPVVTAVSTGASTVRLTWDAVIGSSGYQVFRSETGEAGSFELVQDITSGSTASYTDTGLETGRKYYYMVRSYTNVGTSTLYGTYSEQAAVTPEVRKTIVSVSGSGSTATVRWTSVIGAAGYQILRSATGKADSFALVKDIPDSSVTSYVDTGLIPGRTYYYLVRYYDRNESEVEPGPDSDIASITPAVGRVSTVAAAPAGASSVKVSWTTVLGVSGYQVLRTTNPASGSFTLVKDISDGTTSTFTDTGLTPDTSYYYCIRPYVKSGSDTFYGPYSSNAGVVPEMGKTKATATATDVDAVKIKWNTVSSATGYQVLRSTTGKIGSFKVLKTIRGNASTSYVDTGLTPNRTYYYCVRPYNNASSETVYGQNSSFVNATPTICKPKITATSPDYTKINVSWDAVPGADGYQLLHSATGSVGSFVLLEDIGDGSVTSYTHTDISAASSNYYCVHPYVVIGSEVIFGPYSSYAGVGPLIDKTKVSASTTSYSSNTIKWTAVPGASGYQVLHSSTGTVGSFSVIQDIAGDASMTFIDSSYPLSDTNYYCVRPYITDNDTTVYGPYSDFAAVVPATGKLAAPTVGAITLNAAKPSSGELSFSWNAVDGADGYELYYSVTGREDTFSLLTTVSSGSVSSYGWSGIPAGKTLYFKLRAYKNTAAGKELGSYSDVVSATA